MNVFHKIADWFRQNEAMDELLYEMKNLDEVLLEKRIEIFRERVTPEFAKIGLNNWDGKYMWFSDFTNEGVKHVIEYNVFKFYGGSFTFGNCFYSVPTISGRRLVNHRTDKSTTIHYFNRLEGWQKSLEEDGYRNPDKVSTVNEKKFRATLDAVLKRNIPKLRAWFENNCTVDQNIQMLQHYIKNPPYEFGQRIISCEYVLSFLYKQKGDIESAVFWMNKHFEKKLNKDQEIALIMDKIKKD